MRPTGQRSTRRSRPRYFQLVDMEIDMRNISAPERIKKPSRPLYPNNMKQQDNEDSTASPSISRWKSIGKTKDSFG